jgi:hypothetical protein
MANYDKRIYDLISDIKADKSIHPQWRNKAVARIDEAHAFIEKGQRTTSMKAPQGMVLPNVPVMSEENARAIFGGQQPVSSTNPNQHIDCNCLPGTIDHTCPVHGDAAQ